MTRDQAASRTGGTDERSFALLSGVAVAAWVHAAAYHQPEAVAILGARWPTVVAGAAAMLLSTVRPLRWMIVAAWTALPTTFVSCYFIGAALARGGEVPMVPVRLALTVAVATAIGAAIGRVAGGIREHT